MIEKSSQADFGTGSIGKLLFSMAVPAITAQIINLLYNIVDRMYIGHIPVIGATALTGVGVTFPIITLITAFSSLIGMGGGAGRNFYGPPGQQYGGGNWGTVVRRYFAFQ